MNGDFSVVKDLDRIDSGAFVPLNWKDQTLMLPVSFQEGVIGFSDGKWFLSYKDIDNGFYIDKPRFFIVIHMEILCSMNVHYLMI